MEAERITRIDAELINRLIDDGMAVFQTAIGDDELCLAVRDAIHDAVTFSVGAGVGLGARVWSREALSVITELRALLVEEMPAERYAKRLTVAAARAELLLGS